MQYLLVTNGLSYINCKVSEYLTIIRPFTYCFLLLISILIDIRIL